MHSDWGIPLPILVSVTAEPAQQEGAGGVANRRDRRSGVWISRLNFFQQMGFPVRFHQKGVFAQAFKR
jgi:hypothetical protein